MHSHRPIPSISSIAALSLLALFGSSCSDAIRPPQKAAEHYSGPPLSIESTPPQYRVILTAPTGGWSFRLDQTRRAFDHTDVFVTLTRPDPAYMQTQAQVRQEAGTEIDPSQPITLYARILPHDAKPDTQAYYPVPAAPAASH